MANMTATATMAGFVGAAFAQQRLILSGGEKAPVFG
jgi:hypothetical protein